MGKAGGGIMRSGFCDKCGKLLTLSHVSEYLPCACRIFIITDEDGEKHDGRGRDFKEAIKSFAEKYDAETDYSLLIDQGDGADFFIQDTKTAKTRRIRIFAEQVVEYTIKEL
jgi:hypothetical protein